TRVVGLSIVAKEKGRAILATKPGHEGVALEHGEPGRAAARLSGRPRQRSRLPVGAAVEGGDQIRATQRRHARNRAGDRVHRSEGTSLNLLQAAVEGTSRLRSHSGRIARGDAPMLSPSFFVVSATRILALRVPRRAAKL